MATAATGLSAIQCRAIKAGQRLYDGQGLMLVADDRGARWYLRFTSPETGKRRDAGLGPFPKITLGKARELAEALRVTTRAGRDPIEDRKRAAEEARATSVRTDAALRRDAATLEKLARQYHATIRSGFRNRKHAAQWISSLENDVFETLGSKPVSTITADDLLEVLLPLRERVPETAKRVRERLASVFEDAVLRGLCDRNPADMIRRALRLRGAAPAHLRSLPYVGVPAFVQALRVTSHGSPTVRYALEFLILTAARSGEIRGATWSEIDMKAKTWIIPGERMKAGQEHRVPLAPRAIAILKEAAKTSDGLPGTLVFPGQRGRSLSDMTLTQLLRRMPTGRELEDGESEVYADLTVVHGFRSAFSTWAREQTKFRTDIIEAALAHRERDRVAAAYSRASYLQDRERLAIAWEGFVTSKQAAKVVNIASRRGAG